MYVFIANGFKGIIESSQTLSVLASIYPYPKFRKVQSKEDALKFLNRYNRGEINPSIENYGDTDKYYGYATIMYVIDRGDLYVTIDTSKVGFVRINVHTLKDTVVDNRPSMIRIQIKDMNLNDNLISDHCLAIEAILTLLGGYIDVNIEVPDISIYLALIKYSGENYIINSVQDVLRTRLGGVSVTIK